MFDQFKNLNQLFQQAGAVREKYEKMQAELAERTVIGEAGGGAVRVTVNGKFECVDVALDRPLLASLAGEGSDADAAMVEQLIAGAFNDGVHKAQAMAKEQLGQLSQDLDIPGLEQLLGGGGQGSQGGSQT